MNVHKFNVKSRLSRVKTIHWIPDTNLKHPPVKVSPQTWKIFCQKEITLNPGQVLPTELGLGFSSTKGVILTSLDYSLRYKKCGSQNEISIGDVKNILVTITNNSKNKVKIKENEVLCFVYYHL